MADTPDNGTEETEHNTEKTEHNAEETENNAEETENNAEETENNAEETENNADETDDQTETTDNVIDEAENKGTEDDKEEQEENGLQVGESGSNIAGVDDEGSIHGGSPERPMADGGAGDETASDAVSEASTTDTSAGNKQDKPARTPRKVRLPPPKAFGPAKMTSINFREDDKRNELVLKCDGGDLYCDRPIPMMWSQHFKSLLSSKEFKKQKRCEVPMFEHSIDDMEEILCIIYPPNKPINDDNIEVALRMGKDLEMREVRRRCETFLMKSKITPQLLITAQDYALPALKRKCIELLRTKKYSDLQKDEGFIEKLKPEVHAQLLHDRIRFIEAKAEQSGRKYDQQVKLFQEIVHLFEELQEYACSKKQTPQTRRQTIVICDDALDLLKAYDPNKSESTSEMPKDSKSEKSDWK